MTLTVTPPRPATRRPTPDSPAAVVAPPSPLAEPTVEVPAWVVTAPPDRPAEGEGNGRPLKIRFTLRDVERMDWIGLIPQWTELVDGELYTMAAQGNAHSLAIDDLRDVIRPAWPKPRHVKTQATHRFPSGWLPQPDLVLYDRRPVHRALVDPAPRLVIEVSDTTLADDLGDKRLRYARENVPEYWVADLVHRRIRAFRTPDPTATDALLAYRDEAIAEADDDLSPLAIPTLQIRVSDVLPAAGATPSEDEDAELRGDS